MPSRLTLEVSCRRAIGILQQSNGIFERRYSFLAPSPLNGGLSGRKLLEGVTAGSTREETTGILLAARIQ